MLRYEMFIPVRQDLPESYYLPEWDYKAHDTKYGMRDKIDWNQQIDNPTQTQGIDCTVHDAKCGMRDKIDSNKQIGSPTQAQGLYTVLAATCLNLAQFYI